MRLTSLILLILCLGFNARAQNLVYNGDFEIYDTCPDYPSQIARANGWKTAALTPDYYNSCPNVNSANGINVPYTQMGYQQDYGSGNGIAGIYVFSKTGVNNGDREYIYAKLLDTLISGHKYLASMEVCRANFNYSIATIGMLFTDTIPALPSNQSFISAVPQVLNNSGLTDTLNWTIIQDTITAAGDELYLTLGNFNSNNSSDTVSSSGIWMYYGAAYYFIDKVSVIDIQSIGINTFAADDLSLNIYPNPNNGRMLLEYKIKENATLIITDVHGNPVAKRILPASLSKLEIDNNDLENGVYFYSLLSENNALTKSGKIIIMK